MPPTKIGKAGFVHKDWAINCSRQSLGRQDAAREKSTRAHDVRRMEEAGCQRSKFAFVGVALGEPELQGREERGQLVWRQGHSVILEVIEKTKGNTRIGWRGQVTRRSGQLEAKVLAELEVGVVLVLCPACGGNADGVVHIATALDVPTLAMEGTRTEDSGVLNTGRRIDSGAENP